MVMARIHKLVPELGRKLRGSDHCTLLPDGIIMVIVPEDVQSIPRMQNRVNNILGQLSKHRDLELTTCSKVYPGSGDSPEQLLDAVLKALPKA